jgi:4-alpha-glucanotransferase
MAKAAPMTFNLHERASGILLHPTSLAGPFGNGDLGAGAREFASFLARAGQRWWQMLPVGPVGYGNSPYSAHSAFAGSPLLIDLEELVVLGLIRSEALTPPRLSSAHVDFASASAFREGVLRRAHAALGKGSLRRALDRFTSREVLWLEDYALFMALKRQNGLQQWTRWPQPLRDRVPGALQQARSELARELDFERFCQFLFARQWTALRTHCRELGVALLGDLPIFVAHDSADVWAHPELFLLDRTGEPTHISGVPPDYFSKTGQRWGNPLYRWKVMARDGYAWWTARMAQMLARFDAVRLDHFIGFVRFWQIAASEPTAIHGAWMKGPGAAFFSALQEQLGPLPLIAEDLGAVTPEVTALREAFGFPGLRILQFAFGTDPQAPTFKPHHYPRRTVVYSGTHDNDTVVGWFNDAGGKGAPRSAAQTERERQTARAYLGEGDEPVHWQFIREVQKSVADLAIVPMQDVLGLGSEARMNRPGLAEGNWSWRLPRGALSATTARRLFNLARTYDRHPPKETR